MSDMNTKLNLLIDIGNRNTHLINALQKKVDELLASRPANARALNARATGNISGDVWQHRVGVVERTFWRLANCDWEKRRETYNFPAYLMERLGTPPKQGVVVSVLLNQCALLKAFRPVAGETGKVREIAYEAVKRSTLFLCPANQAFDSLSETEIALSPASAEKFVRNKRSLPDTWLGWTCDERGIAPDQPFDDQEVHPLADVAGARVWDEDEEDAETEQETEEGEDEDEIEAAEAEDRKREERQTAEEARRARLKPVDEEPAPKPYKELTKRVDPDGVPVVGGRRIVLAKREPEVEAPAASAGNSADPLAGRPGLRPLNVVSRSTEGD